MNAGPAASKTAFHLVGRVDAVSGSFSPQTEDGLIPGQNCASIEIVDPRSSKNPGGSTTKPCSLISVFHRGKALSCLA